MNEIDKYIAGFPDTTQRLLKQLRTTIMKAAPEADEVISYNMPAYRFHKMLVYFAAFENHIGFYPTGSGVETFRHEASAYITGKGTLQFPLDKPLPLGLITKIVKYRVIENSERTKKTGTLNT